MSQPEVVGVGALARRIEEALDDESLRNVHVRGEISGLKRGPSGHLYFSLKDDEAVVSCVAWASAARQFRFAPADGQRVVARGNVEFWAEGGRLQFYVSGLALDGEGAAAAALEALRKRLSAEGLFEESRKRQLPPFPRLVGVVTSRGGAVLHDLAREIGRRAPSVRVLLLSVRVQGEGAAQEVAAAIARASSLDPARRPDVLVVARGGGSAEDLAAFNEESVVRAVAACSIPTVSAVGHESDVTLCDHAADVRAATPSAAAEIVTAGLVEAGAALLDSEERMASTLRQRLRHASDRLAGLVDRGPLSEPDRALAGKRQRLDELAGLLHSLSPLAVLGRGYAVARRADGTVLASAAGARVGEDLALVLPDGEVDAKVTSIRRKVQEEAP